MHELATNSCQIGYLPLDQIYSSSFDYLSLESPVVGIRISHKLTFNSIIMVERFNVQLQQVCNKVANEHVNIANHPCLFIIAVQAHKLYITVEVWKV